MARYGRDFERHRLSERNFEEGTGEGYDRDYFGGRGRSGGFRGDTGRNRELGGGYGGEFGGGRNRSEFGYGGMRSDGWGSNWRDFAGEEGWYGQGYAGYPGGDPSGLARGGYGGYGGDYRSQGTWGGFRGRGGREPFRGSNRENRESFERGGRDSFGGRGESFGGGFGGGRGTFGGGETHSGGFGRGERSGSQAERTRAAQIMTENPECVTPDTSVVEAAKKMRDLDVGIIPVVDSHENRRLRGVVTDRDLTVRVLAEGRGGDVKVSDCMTPEVETVNKNDSIREVLSVMQREQVRRVPVTDREGRLVGIIAQADLATDFGEGDWAAEHEVEQTIERISEPARPNRGGTTTRGRGSETGSRTHETETTGARGRGTTGRNTEITGTGRTGGTTTRGATERNERDEKESNRNRTRGR